MEQYKPQPRDKDTHCYPSVACKYNINLDRCTSKDAPRPGHSRCVGSRLCESWMHCSTLV